jgi:virginiamycin B lyase
VWRAAARPACDGTRFGPRSRFANPLSKVEIMSRHILCAAALLVAAADPGIAQTLDVREWPVEWQGRPRDPDVDAQGRVWFVGQTGNYIGVFDPATEQFRRFELEPRTLPHNLIVGRDGAIWYAGNGNGRIGRLDPETGQARTILMPDSAARDPHTLIGDDAGHIWFTVQNGGYIGRLDTESGDVRLIRTEARSRPYGIWLDSKGTAWVNLFGTNRVAAVDPATFAMREVATPRANARTRRIAVTSDDAVWYVDFAGGMLGRIDPASGEIREWPVPGGASAQPYALTIDDQDRLWFSESNRSAPRLVGFDPRTNEFIAATPVSAGIRHMVFHAPTRTLWFGTDANNIGRAVLK